MCICNGDSDKGGEEEMGRFVDDPFEEHERDMWKPVQRPEPLPYVWQPPLDETPGDAARRAIREARALLVTESKKAS